MRLTRKNVRVGLERLGEGLNGDYNEDDPDDKELFRFWINKYNPFPGVWLEVEDSSYCTLLPVTISKEDQKKALKYIMDEVYDGVTAGYSVKKICEKLSWISLDIIDALIEGVERRKKEKKPKTCQKCTKLGGNDCGEDSIHLSCFLEC